MPIAKLKAFTGINEDDAKTYQRWGAAPFDKNQCRIVCSNALDSAADVPPTAGHTSLNHAQFMRMISPAWCRDATEQDVMAILKRASFVVNTAHGILIRPPSEKPADVRFVSYQHGKTDFLDDTCKPTT